MPAHAHRHVTRRDGALEGEPDPESDRGALKDAQRDLTSLSGPPIKEKEKRKPQ